MQLFCLVSGPPLDIGTIVDSVHDRRLTFQERVHILEYRWIAPEGFKWPQTECQNAGKSRKKFLGQQHFQGCFEVFAYSLSKQGIFCKPCVLFAPESAGGVKLDRLVRRPLQKYSHLAGRDGYLTSHIKSKFHEDSITKAKAFIDNQKTMAADAAQMLNAAAAIQRKKNRDALARIIQCIEFHGRLGLPLRGHRDSGELQLSNFVEKLSIDYSQGNMRALLQLMVACNDTVLEDHLRTAGKNATYISSVSQNSLIDSISTVIQRAIVAEIREARFFSLLADETTDFSHQEQLSVCLQYVLPDCTIRERFLCFALAPDVTGLGLATQLLEILTKCGIDAGAMVGQGYDGAGAMRGEFNGVQKHVMDKCPFATYVHCASHSLNLCLVKAAEVQMIRAAVTVMHEIAVFYNDSNKRLLNLTECIDEKCPESSRLRLKKHCSTRWVERQEAVLVFKELYPAVCISLEQISAWRGDCGGKAAVYIRSLDGGFLVAMETLITVLQVSFTIRL